MRRIYLAVLMSGLLLSPSLYAQDTDPAPAEPEVTPVAAEESVKEAPVEAAVVTTDDATAVVATVVAEADEEASEEEKKPWSVSLGVSHSAGSGTFVPTVYKNSLGHVGQSWSVGAGYGFELFGQKLRAGIGFGTSVTLTKPQSSPSRRVNPSDTSLSLSAGSLYENELTGINLSGGLSMSLPTSYASLNGRKNYGGFSARLGLSRSFGGFNVSYGFSASHTLYESKVATNYTEVISNLNSTVCADTGDDVFRCFAGYANPFLGLNNSLSLGYNITDDLSIGDSVSVRNVFKYAVANENDGLSVQESGEFINSNGELTQGNQAPDAGVGTSEGYSTGLSISYALSESLENILDLPFSLSMSAGVSSSHGAQRFDNDQKKYVAFPPLLFNGWGDQSANGYGSVYLSLNGSY